jgi:hypothetical protein
MRSLLTKENTMSKGKMLVVVLLGATALATFISYAGSLGALADLHPEIDRKILKKAHREMILDSLKGRNAEIVDNDEEIDKRFLQKVQKFTNK